MTTPRYDADTSNKMNKMTPMIGSNNANAAIPARGSSSIMTCSGPYAVEEIASGESAPSATGFDNLSDSSCSLVSGLPRTMRFHPSTKVGEMLELRSDVVTTFTSSGYSMTCRRRSFRVGPSRVGHVCPAIRNVRPSWRWCCPGGLRDSRLYVVGHDLRADTRDPADHPGDLIGSAIMQQPAQQRRIRSAWQQHRHLGVRMIPHDLQNQLLRGPEQVAIHTLDQPQLGRVPEVLPAPLQPRGVSRI